MVLAYYVIICILSFLCCVIFFWRVRSNFSPLYSLIFILALLAHLSYVMLALSENVREALLANKMLYIGGCYLQMIGMFLIITICNIRPPKWIRFLMVLFSTAVYGCVLTAGYLPIFYKSVEIEKRNGITVLIKEYGPAHMLFYTEIILYLFITIGVLIYGWMKRPDVSRRNLLIASIMQITSIFAFFVGRSITKNIEWMALADLVDEIGFLLIMDRVVLYRVDDLVSSSILKDGQFGYLSLDLNHKYLGATEAARRFLPEIVKNHTDREIENSELRDLFGKWIEEYEEKKVSTVHTYRRKGCIYLIRISSLYDGKRKRGYLLEISDDTAHQQHLEGIERYNKNLNEELMAKTKLIRELRNKK